MDSYSKIAKEIMGAGRAHGIDARSRNKKRAVNPVLVTLLLDLHYLVWIVSIMLRFYKCWLRWFRLLPTWGMAFAARAAAGDVWQPLPGD